MQVSARDLRWSERGAEHPWLGLAALEIDVAHADPQRIDIARLSCEGLQATLEVLRGGTPWPVTLKLEPEGLREPAFVTAARTTLGQNPQGP